MKGKAMNAKARRSMILARVVLAFAAVAAAVAWAMPPYQEALFTRYPNAATALPNCIACHEGPGANSLNNFASDFLAKGFTFDAALEARDSDGDGVSNGAELTASPASAPGDPASRPGAVTPPTSPPVVVTDGATLYANYCAACHAPLVSSSKAGATLARMQGAISGNVGGMGHAAGNQRIEDATDAGPELRAGVVGTAGQQRAGREADHARCRNDAMSAG